jgi:hypothetical protein
VAAPAGGRRAACTDINNRPIASPELVVAGDRLVGAGVCCCKKIASSWAIRVSSCSSVGTGRRLGTNELVDVDSWRHEIRSNSLWGMSGLLAQIFGIEDELGFSKMNPPAGGFLAMSYAAAAAVSSSEGGFRPQCLLLGVVLLECQAWFDHQLPRGVHHDDDADSVGPHCVGALPLLWSVLLFAGDQVEGG